VHGSRAAWLNRGGRWRQPIAGWWVAELAKAREELRVLEVLPYWPDLDEEPELAW
jgi:hypothetical protein